MLININRVIWAKKRAHWVSQFHSFVGKNPHTKVISFRVDWTFEIDILQTNLHQVASLCNMSNSYIFSALTVVALTGTILIHLKHEHDSENLHQNTNTSAEHDYDEFDFEENEVNPNPKILNVLNSSAASHSEKFINKRSSASRAGHSTPQLSIVDKNLTQVDQFRRDKIKEVKHTCLLWFQSD